jgi:ubiquinone/menaquinone biosynthesis C-methylase UbiE/uncharacterized protein YbaR (Trm112 family)
MNMENYYKLKTILLPILKCTFCNNDKLSLNNTDDTVLNSHKLHTENIVCESCGEKFPITEDFIPIMWSKSLKAYLMDMANFNTNIGANVKVYDKISDDYLKHTRINNVDSVRLQNAVKSILPSNRSYSIKHLDLGCGPGQVLNWLKEFDFEQFGLDVSIQNLRTARQLSGAIVVCGDATVLPFINSAFNIVTESSALHHIEEWKQAIFECCRVCNNNGAVILDSEPSKDELAWSWLAIAVYNMRFPVYKILSYFDKTKYIYRNTKQAKNNLLAEIHHQPGTGFCLEELRNIFCVNNFNVNICQSPNCELVSVMAPSLKQIIISILSLRNPWNSKYGRFTAIARKKSDI